MLAVEYKVFGLQVCQLAGLPAFKTLILQPSKTLKMELSTSLRKRKGFYL
jgi:hypothetical protein